ncbi:M20 family metallopeptidase [Rhodopirellula baltica]|uniref:Protein containing Peptidase M28 domain protein n=1 Tax=Rhodopirellula baltica SWK14 TaxID=993516 RepID=L7CNJ0_RHOBT|nr:M28 family peptidase [Rhodopirellula baltica]ELP34626.1 protein containing Peptidase M28 domain protein [Rhodopirellula baltica SWK14]
MNSPFERLPQEDLAMDLARQAATKTTDSSHRHARSVPENPSPSRTEMDSPTNSRGGNWPRRLLTLAVVAVFAYVGVAVWQMVRTPDSTSVAPAALGPVPERYDADRAFGFLVDICDLGPRPSGSPAMLQQQKMLTEVFEANGGTVRLQRGEIRHPQTGENVPIANLIAAWNPDAPTRFLLCAHYDTRPYPDRDRRDPKGVFVGANDGASGAAALMELSHQFPTLPSDIGVDVVLFDAEEFVFGEQSGEYFLGSTLFAQQYLLEPPTVPYQSGVLLDMIADRELQLLYERNSLRYARDVTRSIWATAKRLGVNAFVPRARSQAIRDDHLPLNQIAKIPTTDLIDFDYPRPGFRAPQYWHTTQDIPENCSGESIAAVIWVVHEWMLEQSGG